MTIPAILNQSSRSLRAIACAASSSPYGWNRVVGTLHVGAEGIAFTRSETESAERWRPTRPAGAGGSRARRDGTGCPTSAEVDPVNWPTLMGRLEFSRGDWHCPRSAIHWVERSGWAALVVRLATGRLAARGRGYLLHGDCSRCLLVPDAARERFEEWLEEMGLLERPAGAGTGRRAPRTARTSR